MDLNNETQLVPNELNIEEIKLNDTQTNETVLIKAESNELKNTFSVKSFIANSSKVEINQAIENDLDNSIHNLRKKNKIKINPSISEENKEQKRNHCGFHYLLAQFANIFRNSKQK